MGRKYEVVLRPSSTPTAPTPKPPVLKPAVAVSRPVREVLSPAVAMQRAFEEVMRLQNADGDPTRGKRLAAGHVLSIVYDAVKSITPPGAAETDLKAKYKGYIERIRNRNNRRRDLLAVILDSAKREAIDPQSVPDPWKGSDKLERSYRMGYRAGSRWGEASYAYRDLAANVHGRLDGARAQGDETRLRMTVSGTGPLPPIQNVLEGEAKS
jgi:hypothetical protein